MRVYLPWAAFCQLSSEGVAGAEHDDRTSEFGAHHGERDIAGVVARHFFLLVTLVVLFVDEDQAEVRQGREDSRTGADNDGRFTASDAAPLLAALFGREGGVQQGHLASEGGVERGRRSGE